MAKIVYPREANRVPVLIATVEEAERAWDHSRADWGWEEAEDLDEVAISLSPTICYVWAVQGEGPEAYAYLLDDPKNTDKVMVEAFQVENSYDIWWDWEEDYKGEYTPEQAAGYAPDWAVR